MRSLILLSLAENTLSGVIPRELGLMAGIEAMYLASNKLSGQIPEDMENMTSIYHLDLSFNHLVGKVPLQGVFSNVTGFYFMGILGSAVASQNYVCPHAHQNTRNTAYGYTMSF